MKYSNLRTRLAQATAVSLLIGGYALPGSWAQEDTITLDQDAGAVEEEARQETIVVTGSLIPQSANLVGTSPVSTISADEFDIRGAIRAEDLINTMPQAFGAQGASLANGATGTASVNLRGLGASRTLVLMNGRRLPYGSTNIAAPDINTIPSALVKQVDILTGGASATYGSDAISGVVNFIMDTDFEGAQFEMNYGTYQHNNGGELQPLLKELAGLNPDQYDVPSGNVFDGESIDLTAVIGGDFADGKGHVSAYVAYQDVKPVLQGDRDYSQCALSTRNDGTEFTCAGSSTNQFTNLLSLGGTLPEGSWARVDPATGEFVERDFLTDTFNYNPFNHYQRPNTRYNFGTFLEYDVNDTTSLYSELMFVHNRTNSQIAPSGVFGYGVAGGNGGLNCDNPYLSDQQRTYIGCTAADIANGVVVGDGDLIALRRNVEGGPRNNDISHQSFRGVLGFEGTIGDSPLNYDFYGSFARTDRTGVYNNDLSIRKLSAALYAVTDDDGNIVCNINADADPTNDDAACVPYDIWSGNAPDPNAVSYIVSPLNDTGYIIQTVVSGKIFGSFADYGIQNPYASDDAAFAFGAEYRRDEVNREPDANFQSGDGAGQGGPTNAISGSQDVYDLFAEVDIPLIQEQPWIYDFGVDGSYRLSQYSDF
ncbi:MAG: TonB-dependent receptor plug domain-containing protein, partial [Pseudomonadota bacterium]